MKQLLRSPLFLLGLALLLLNDFVLKEAFGNALTGKLSDFAGMFIFPLFWLALFPKYKRLIFVMCGLFFIWWKSPMSQAGIHLWNGLGVFQVGRVVDYSDLWALLMLPLAWWYAESDRTTRLSIIFQKIPPAFPVALACFAFIATSEAIPRYGYEPPKVYSFDFSKDTLALRIYELEEINILNPDDRGYFYWNPDSMMRLRNNYRDSLISLAPIEIVITDTMELEIFSDLGMRAEISFEGDSLTSLLKLYRLEGLAGREDDENLFLNEFQKTVIDKLR